MGIFQIALMLATLLLSAACTILTISSLLSWHGPSGAFLLVGSLLYLFGTILVTIRGSRARVLGGLAMTPNHRKTPGVSY